jgi:hypothetical protein
MAGLVPAIPINTASPCSIYRDARVKPAHDGYDIAANFAIGIMRCCGQDVGKAAPVGEETPG